MSRLLLGAALGLVVGLGVAGWVYWFMQPPKSIPVSRFQQGRMVAERSGCFLCHGPDGKAGTTNFTPELDEVPAWSQSNFSAYIRSPEEVREWILNGAPKRMLDDPSERVRLEKQLLRMPVYRDQLLPEELEALVFYVTASGQLLPMDEESPEGRGRSVALRLGCFGCHGAEGLGRAANPGSLKGYVPAWHSSDYDELVVGTEELKEWVLDGAPKRLRLNPAANFFLTRQAVKMPAYREKMSGQELEDLVTYVQYLRAKKQER